MEVKGDMLAHPDPERWGLDVIASALPWQPVVDGDVVPVRPIDALDAGAGRIVDVIVGSNADDWRMFRVLSGDLDSVTEEVLAGPVVRHGYLTAAAYGLPTDGLAAYRALHPEAGPGDLLVAIETDWWCRIPGVRLAEAHVPGPGRTYMYEFAWPAPAFGGALGACHALEIPFVFDTLDLGPRQMLGALLGPEPPHELAKEIHGAWVRFARTGEPGWPPYELEERATIRFGTPSEVVEDPRAAERAIWAGLM
jgi:para-nitrobenzyl esterase